MRILLEDRGGRLTLEAPDHFRSLSVVAPGVPDAEFLATAVARIGRADGSTHVFVAPFALVSLAGDRGRDVRWLGSLRDMMSYAREHGWVDARGGLCGRGAGTRRHHSRGRATSMLLALHRPSRRAGCGAAL